MSGEDRFRRPEGGDARLIARDDLLACLDRAANGKVTIISAPAGSGKSSLLRAWIGRPSRPERLAVVQVHRDQQDAQDFWLALLDAVRRAAGTAAGVEPSTPAPQFSAAAMADRTLSEFAAAGGDLTLVVDDLHELRCPETLGELSRLLTNLPPRTHVVLTTRRDLPLHLHQLRLKRELAEIRVANLRFTQQETRELLAASDVGLSQAGVAMLHQRTEGWAAGLRLAVLSLAGHPDPERFVAEFSGSDRMVAEYLLAEMLDRQPDDVQHLLLRTCVLDRVNGELADLLTGRTGSERILLDLEDANAFVVSLDPERTWFRYHHLFGDLLRLELRRTLAAEIPELHRRAAAWSCEHGRVIEAIRHAQAAGGWAEAARLLAEHCFSLTLDGHTQALQALLQAFPPGFGDAPELALVHATSELATGHLDEAAAYLSLARSGVETASGDHVPRLRSAVKALDLWMARRRGDLAAAEQAAIIDLPVTGRSDREIALASDLRAAALMNLGTVEAWSLRLPDAERHLQEGAALARQIGRPYLEVGCLAQLGYASSGRSFAIAVQRCREAIALAERHGWATEPVVAPALVTLADRLIWMAELDEGETWLQRTSHALRSDAGPGIRLLLHLVTGMLRGARGRHHQALTEFSAADGLRSRLAGPPTLASQVTGWMLAAQARAGQVAEARAALETLPDRRAGGGEINTAEAVICLADGDPVGALIALKSVLDGLAPVIGQATVLETHLLAGLAHRELDDHIAANHAVERALELAEPDRLVLPFLLVSGSLQLLEALPRHETAHAALLVDILDILRSTSPPPQDTTVPPWTLRFSRTELKVLRYLPTNMSRPEIARELSVSANTVSTHVRNIYAKLGADDRSGAVRRARQLRLLSGVREEALTSAAP